jgi:hypothetical protein
MSVNRWGWLVVAVTGVIVPRVWADTVYFKDGSALDGVITFPDANTVVVLSGPARMTFPASEVARVEKNDKKGDFKSISVIKGKQHEDALFQRTGLTAPQRDAVRAAVDPLWSPDEAQRSAARKKLVAMSKDMPVFQYIESFLPYSKPLLAPELMKALVEIDPQRAKNVVGGYVQDVAPGNRASALQLIASYKKDEDLDTIARGLVDPDSSVRVAAAHAVAEAGAKRATPALIEALKSPDLKVQNAVRAALKGVWSSENMQVDLKTPEEWRTFWAGKAGNIKDPLEPKDLTPLVTQEELSNATSHHDE